MARPRKINPDTYLKSMLIQRMVLHGENHKDVEKILGLKRSKFYDRKNNPYKLTLEEFRILCKHYSFTQEEIFTMLGLKWEVKA